MDTVGLTRTIFRVDFATIFQCAHFHCAHFGFLERGDGGLTKTRQAGNFQAEAPTTPGQQCEILWRLAQCKYELGEETAASSGKGAARTLYFDALEHAREGVRLNDNSAAAHKVK